MPSLVAAEDLDQLCVLLRAVEDSHGVALIHVNDGSSAVDSAEAAAAACDFDGGGGMWDGGDAACVAGAAGPDPDGSDSHDDEFVLL